MILCHAIPQRQTDNAGLLLTLFRASFVSGCNEQIITFLWEYSTVTPIHTLCGGNSKEGTEEIAVRDVASSKIFLHIHLDMNACDYNLFPRMKEPLRGVWSHDPSSNSAPELFSIETIQLMHVTAATYLAKKYKA